MQKIFIGLTLLISYSNGFIVPQEVPSILSLVYSNIPPIKKGTDSRVGFGFRLGEHADFQVQFELGPQKFTKPIGKGPTEFESSDTSKRMVDQTDFSKKPKAPKESGNQWLNDWAAEMKIKTTQKTRKPHTNAGGNEEENNSLKSIFRPGNQFPIPTAPIIPQSSLQQLQQLYGKEREYSKNNDSDSYYDQGLGTLPSKSMEAHVLAARAESMKLKKEKLKADLMDVSVDK